MRYTYLATILLACCVIPASADSASFEKTVQAAIDSFEPPWLPSRSDLDRLVVVIDPQWQDGDDRRESNVWSLLTAEHLYHLVQRGGGIPVMTRADDVPCPGAHAAYLASRCTQARCHLFVSIAFEAGGGDAWAFHVSPAGEHPFSAELAKALGGESAGKGVAGEYPRTPGVVVTFPLPSDGADARQPQPPHRSCAEALYKGIHKLADGHRSELDAQRPARSVDGDSPETQPVPLYGERRPRGQSGGAARQLWPQGPLPEDRIAWFCNLYTRVALSDRTIVHFAPQPVVEDGTVILQGTTNTPLFVEGLTDALEALGVSKLRDEIRVLPDTGALGGSEFGVCIAAMARTFAVPNERSTPQTQLLYGEPVLLLDRRDDFLMLQAGDGYWGWARAEMIRALSREEYTAYLNAPQAVLLKDVVLDGQWARRGTRLPVISRDAERVVLRRPDGQSAQVRSVDVQVVDDTEQMQARVLGALAMLHTPYVFGARSPVGIDCSGLVGNLMEREGQAPARDAAQQFLSGKLVGTPRYRDAIRAGDRLYFINASGKISHTGIAMSPTHFIHSSPPGVQINSLRKGDRLYSAHWDETFLGAKRP